MTYSLAAAETLAPVVVGPLRASPSARPDIHQQLGLTDLDAARIDAAIAAGRAASTRATYASAWRRFERWADGRGIPVLPATPATVCAYLIEFAESGVTVAPSRAPVRRWPTSTAVPAIPIRS